MRTPDRPLPRRISHSIFVAFLLRCRWWPLVRRLCRRQEEERLSLPTGHLPRPRRSVRAGPTRRAPAAGQAWTLAGCSRGPAGSCSGVPQGFRAAARATAGRGRAPLADRSRHTAASVTGAAATPPQGLPRLQRGAHARLRARPERHLPPGGVIKIGGINRCRAPLSIIGKPGRRRRPGPSYVSINDSGVIAWATGRSTRGDDGHEPPTHPLGEARKQLEKDKILGHGAVVHAVSRIWVRPGVEGRALRRLGRARRQERLPADSRRR